MKKIYSNPEMELFCFDSEPMTLDLLSGSQESDNINFSWDQEVYY